jgi:nucleoside-diphosphate-sugar epimerase
MNLFCFGLGYSAETLLRLHSHRFASVSGTVRTLDKARRLVAEGVEADVYAGGEPGEKLNTAIAGSNRLLVSAAPDERGDPMLRQLRPALEMAERLEVVVYLSTVGVYGDHGGGWVDEETPVNPGSERAKRRVMAEREWLAFGASRGVRVQIHSLAGIYGPGRSAIDDLRDGTARRIVKPGQVFNRIHVDDIAAAVIAGFDNPMVSGVFNICDDEPAPPQDVVAYAAGLLGLPPPPETPFAEARLSEMGRSFYSESKRCRNGKAKGMLGFKLAHPTYREGLVAIATAAQS